MKSERQVFSPSAESLQTIAACTQMLSPDDPLLAEWHDSYIANHKLRIALDLDLARSKIPANSSVLECGSIPLLFTTALSQYKYHVTGCDIAPERYTSAVHRTGVNVVRCNIETEELPFADNTFDAIVFNELFEHLRINPIFTLSEVYRVMKPGATLMLSSPNLRSLGGLRNILLRNRAYSRAGNIYTEYSKLARLGHMGHVREYTTREVTEFLDSVGFGVRELVYRGHYGTRLAQVLVRLIPSLSPFVSYIAVKDA